MAVTIRRVQMLQTSIRNKPGVLEATLEPLAQAGVDLSVVMTYSLPGQSNRAIIETLAGSGRRAARAAHAAKASL